MAPDHFPRTNQLAAHRVAARLTQEEVAIGLSKLAVSLDGAGANVTAEMVSRWERGHRRPSKYYRGLLASFFDASEVDLGLRLPPIPRYAGRHSSEIEMKRRQFLYHLALLTGLSALDLERMADAFDRPRTVNDQLMDDLHTVVLGYARDAHVVSPGVLLPAVTGHLVAVQRQLDVSQPESAGRRLRIIAGEAGALAGWLAYLLDSNQAAAGHYATAEALATEAGDGQLRAYVLTLRSWLYSSVSRQHPAESALTAITLLNEAVTTAGATAHQNFRAWMLARRAQQHASAREGPAALADLETIGAVLGGPAAHTDGFLARWNPESRVPSSRGKVALFLGQSDAVPILEAALARTDPLLAAQRAALKNDLAAAYVRTGEPDIEHACAILGDSIGLAEQAGANACIQHARDVRRLLEPWHTAQAVQQLDEQLHELA